MNEIIEPENVEIQPIEVGTTTIPEFVIFREKFKFLDNEFLEDVNKITLFGEVVGFVKANVNAPNKSTKVSICYVLYKLIKYGVVTNESVHQQINAYLNHINTNINQYTIDLGTKYTLQDKFLKFSNNYLLENFNEQIYQVQEIQQDIQP